MVSELAACLAIVFVFMIAVGLLRAGNAKCEREYNVPSCELRFTPVGENNDTTR